MEWSDDVTQADWIVERLHPFATDLGSIIPEGFSTYARILHPTWRGQWDQRTKVRWSELAQAAGTRLQPRTRFEELASSELAGDVEEPRVGVLEKDELDVLVDLLPGFTTTPQLCWFAVWEGYGVMQGPPAVATVTAYPREAPADAAPAPPFDRPALPLPVPPGPRVQIPERSLALYSGPIEAATALSEPLVMLGPNLWWPDDRAWCLASEIDFHSTYIGGSQALIDRILHDQRLEALPARITDRLSD